MPKYRAYAEELAAHPINVNQISLDTMTIQSLHHYKQNMRIRPGEAAWREEGGNGYKAWDIQLFSFLVPKICAAPNSQI